MLRSTLKNLGLKKGDVIYCASFLGFHPNHLNCYDEIIDSILEVIGNSGTLVMPSFSFEFCDQAIFDVRRSKSWCGVLAEHFRCNRGSTRSKYPPIHTINAIGALSTELCTSKSITSFGENSAFRILEEVNCKYLLYGASFNDGFAHSHMLEEENIPSYRSWKSYCGHIIDLENREYYCFDRLSRNREILLDCSPLGAYLENIKIISKECYNGIPIRSFELLKVLDVLRPIFRRNPEILVV